MFDNLKHTLLLFSVGLMIFSCTSDEPDAPHSAVEILFDTALNSRATATQSNTLTSRSFALFGDMIYNNLIGKQDSRPVILYNNTEVKFSTTTSWQPSGDRQYWFPVHTHTFVALHPYGNSFVSDYNYLNSRLSFTYTQPQNYQDASDMLVAVHRRNYVEGPTDAVHFRFDHILSNINIRVSYYNPNNGVRPLSVDHITFKNIPASATYSIAPAALAGNSSTYDYADNLSLFEGLTINSRDDLKIEFSGDEARNIPPDNKPCELFSGDDALLLIPNPETSTEMTVSYTTYPGGKPHDESETLTIPVSLLPGRTYTLLLSVRDDKLKFSFDVAEWKVGGTTNTIVPRTRK